MASTEEITELLTDVSFPLTREELLAHAHEEGANENVLDDLRTLPDKTFSDLMDVWDSFGIIEHETSLGENYVKS